MPLIIAVDKDGNETRIGEEFLEQHPESGLRKIADIVDDVIIPIKKTSKPDHK